MISRNGQIFGRVVAGYGVVNGQWGKGFKVGDDMIPVSDAVQTKISGMEAGTGVKAEIGHVSGREIVVAVQVVPEAAL